MAMKKYIPTAALLVVGLGLVVVSGAMGGLQSTATLVGSVTIAAGVITGVQAVAGK